MKLGLWDRFLLSLAPRYAVNRLRARSVAESLASVRHYDAAQPGRRTSGWPRSFTDADGNIRGQNIELRLHARDLIRNNAWARRAQRVIANNTVGWGIVAKPTAQKASVADRAAQLWKAWAETTECESEGRHTFYGLQHMAMKSIAESGEVLFRRRWRKAKDNLTLPIQIQILEADHLDSSRNALNSASGGPIIQGIEFNPLGRRTGYWLYPQHPGSGRNTEPPQFVSAAEIIHVYYTERPNQTRGVSWYAPVILSLKDFDEFEDAALMRQKIAACFAAFVQDIDGSGASVGVPGQPDGTADDGVETFEPGMIEDLPAGKTITFANPPNTVEGAFTERTLRRIAAAMSLTYEDLSQDYSQVNFSSARMSRLAHWSSVHDWRWNMLIPLLCDGVWSWAMEAAVAAGELPESEEIGARWTPPPMPMIEPDKEALAVSRQVRNGMKTISEMVREQGGDPDTHFKEFAEDLKRLDGLKIILDCDPRKTTAAGQEQPSEAAPENATPAQT